jgi:23S rRNA (guanosine2251-2'-O)-methyltransferase
MQKKHRQSLPKPDRHASPRHTPKGEAGGGIWLYGYHAVEAALANPERVVKRLVCSSIAREKLKLPSRTLPTPELMEPRALDQLLGQDAVHQGIAALVQPLPTQMLEDVLYKSGILVILDQVSDPHNVGAILRSAAAFDAIGVIAPKDHSAPETATMAKAASGALDIVPRITVTNLASAMRELRDEGWWIIGLAGEAATAITDIKIGAKTALVLGAEGKGMRRLTSEHCDELARLPISPRMESLNVSNAAVLALYHCATEGKRRG